MKKSIILLYLLSLSSVFFAQLENSLLWKVEGKNLNGTSYLYGTFHSGEDKVYFLMDSIQQHIKTCKIMTGEINMQEQSELDPMVMMKKMTMADRELKDLYDEETFTYIDNRLRDELGPLSMMVQSMKPFYVSVMLSEDLSLGGMMDRKILLDDSLQVFARGEGLKVFGLESAEEALGIIDSIGIEEQADMLFKSLKEMEETSPEDMMETLMNYYVSQDLNGMLSVYEEEELGNDFESLLVDRRNDYFVERLVEHMKDESTFCAVGSLHLPGETGMIAQLRAMGYSVEPILYDSEGK